MIKNIFGFQGTVRGFSILIAVEFIILGLLSVGPFGRRADFRAGVSFLPSETGVYEEETGSWSFDAAAGQAAGTLKSEPVSLPAGVYRVALRYETDTDLTHTCGVADDGGSFGGLLSGGTPLYAGLDSTDCAFWLLYGTETLQVQVNFSGTGNLTVRGLEIYGTNALRNMAVFFALILFLCVDAAWLYRARRKQKPMAARDKWVAAGVFLIIFCSSLPLMTDYLPVGGDLIFHLMRIEGVKDGLLSGQFPVRIAPQWQYGYGYASSVFYGDALLYIPALFRLIGFSVQTSYKMFLFLLNAGTCLTAYFCFAKIFRDKYLGVLCSMLYTLSIYRIYRMYCAGALGEAVGMLFLPLLAAGLYRVFTEDTADRRYRRNWLWLTAGFAGLVQSHILSTYLAAGFTLFTCFILWKKVFRKETFLVLAKTVLFTSLLSAWFIVPFFDYMFTGDFVVQHISGRPIQYRGLQPAQLFQAFPRSGDNPFFYEGGMAGAEPAAVGLALLAGLFLFFLLLWSKKTFGTDGKVLRAGKTAALLAVIAMLMSLSLFPWDRIQRAGSLPATLVSSLEFPHRFLLMATPALVVAAGTAGVCVWNSGSRALKAGFTAGLAALTLLGSVYLLNDLLNTKSFYRIYNEETMGSGYVSSGEYLPAGTDTGGLAYRGPIPGEGVTVNGFEKRYLSVKLDCAVVPGAESYIDLPMLYYKGYRAADETGEALGVGAGLNNSVRVALPAGFRGRVTAAFHSPWHWRAAELVSLLTLLCMAGMYVYRKREVRHADNRNHNGKRGE